MNASSPWILQCRSPTGTGWSPWGNACIYTHGTTLTWIIRDMMKYVYLRSLLPGNKTMWRMRHCRTYETIYPNEIDPNVVEA